MPPSQLTLWTTRMLAATLRDDRRAGIPNYFLDTYFKQEFYSETKEIMLHELPSAYRTLAPFVLPLDQGKPIYREKQTGIRSFLPGYIKPKDSVSPVDVAGPDRRVMLGEPDLGLQQKFDLAVMKRQDEHVRSIRTTWAWMAARAMIDGKVTIKYHREQGAAYQQVLVDFGRDGAHTVIKTANFWDNQATLILNDIELWAGIMVNALRGGMPTRMYVGSQVAPVFKNNQDVLSKLDTTVRQNAGVNISTGITVPDFGLTYLGTLGTNLEVYCYKDDFEDDTGTMVPVLGPKDILLVAPGCEGLRAFGAVYNAKAVMEAGGRPMRIDIYPSMWLENDPSQMSVMHESAPLMIPLYPNRTLKATVLP